MAACKASDQLHDRSSLPSGFEDLLNDLVRSVVTSQPLDLMDHIADFLEALVDRRTLWDMQLEHGKQRPTNKNQKSNVIKSETDKTGTHDTQPCSAAPKPCPTPPKRLNNATRNLQNSPSPKPESDSNDDSISVEVKVKQRPVSRKPIRNGNGLTKQDAWTDEVVLSSHLAQHEALRQVIKEIGDMNEQIIALEETVGNTAQRTQKTRNTTQARDLADKHSSLKTALDKMMLICSWIKSNELSNAAAPEIHENLVKKTGQRERHVNGVNPNNIQGTLENQLDTLKDTMEHVQAALTSKRRGETTNRSAQDDNMNILDDINKLNQWLQYMLQMRGETQPPQVTANQDSTSTQNITTMTNTTQGKKASPKKQKKVAVETDASSSSIVQSSANSLDPGKQTTASTVKHHEPTNAPQKETHIKLQYYVSETDKKKDTRLMLESTSRESNTACKATPINFKSVAVVESNTSGESGTKQDTSNLKKFKVEGAEKSQHKVKSVLPPDSKDSRRCSIPVPLRKPPKTAHIHLNSSESDLARMRLAGMDTPKSQTTTNDESNVANIDSYSAVPEIYSDSTKVNLPLSHESMTTSSYVNVFCTQSISSVSQNSWYPNQTAMSQEKHPAIANNEPKACVRFPSNSAQPTAKKKATQGRTDTQNVDISPQPSACKAVASGSSLLPDQTHTNKNSVTSNQPTDERVLSNQIFSASSIKSTSYVTAHWSVQKVDTSTPKIENAEKSPQNVSFQSFSKSSSHSTARSSPQKGDTTKPATKTTPDNLPPNSDSTLSFLKLSSHSTTTKSSPQKGDTPKKENATYSTTETASDDLPPNVYSSVSFFKTSSYATTSHATTKSSPQKVDTAPENQPPNIYSVSSFAKASSHSTAKSDSKKGKARPASKDTSLLPPNATPAKTASQSTANGDPKKDDAGSSSKDVTVAATQANGSTSTSSVKVASNSVGEVSTSNKDIVLNNAIGTPSASFTKSSGQALAPQKGETPPSSKEVTSNNLQPDAKSASFTKPSDRSPATSSSHKVDSTTKAANTENLQPNDASSAKPPSSHSITKSGTQKAITSSVQPSTDQTKSPRYVEYTNIFPQIANMQITPEPSNTILSKQHLLSMSTRSLDQPAQTHHESGILSGAAPSIERVKTQKATSSPQEKETTKLGILRVEDPVEKAFGKISSEIIPKQSSGGSKQTEATSLDSAKLDKGSIHSTSKSMGITKQTEATSLDSAKQDKGSTHSTSKSMGITKQTEATSLDSAKQDKGSTHSTSKSMGSTKQTEATSLDSAKLDKGTIHSTSKSMGSTKQREATSLDSAKLDKGSTHSTSKSMGSTKQTEATSLDSAKLDKGSTHSTSKSMGSTKQTEATSLDSTKLEKASIHSSSMSATNSNKQLPTASHNSESIIENKESGKQVQRSRTEVSELPLTAESNNNNTKTQQGKGQLGKIPIVHRNPSEVSLNSFKMPEQTIKEANESETTE